MKLLDMVFGQGDCIGAGKDRFDGLSKAHHLLLTPGLELSDFKIGKQLV